jgi:hypothetical protein
MGRDTGDIEIRRRCAVSVKQGQRGDQRRCETAGLRRMAHNPATTGNASMRQYVARRCNRQSKPASGALREARSPALVA